MSATSNICQVNVTGVSLDIAIDPAFLGQGTAGQAPKPVLGLAIVAHPHPLFGGSRDNKVVMTIARALTNHGFHVLRPNFRGVGKSSGSFDNGIGESRDLFELHQDCCGATAPAWWPRSSEYQWPAKSQRVLAGFSFGAFVQTLVAQQIKEETPVLALVGLAVARFPAASVGVGTLVVHGEQDDVVPLGDVLNWARPMSQPVTVIPGAGHFFHGQLIALKTIVSDYLLARYNTLRE
jgi:uncharacterized protein